MSRVTSPTTRFTVEELFRMVEADVFCSRRVELINGRIYRMAPQGHRHMVTISRVAALLLRIQAQTEWVIIQGTYTLDRFSAPDPDLLWLPVAVGTPEHEWPSPILVIEVSDTTYKKDCGIKLRKYAQSKVPEYWVINLPADRVEVHSVPQNPTGRLADCRYLTVHHYSRGQFITPHLRPDVQLAVDDLLPPTSPA